MSESRFCRAAALLLIVGLFYLGRRLSQPHSVPTVQFTKTASAGDVAVYSTDSTDHASLRIITTNEDGTLIRVWHIRKGSNQVHFYGEFPARKE